MTAVGYVWSSGSSVVAFVPGTVTSRAMYTVRCGRCARERQVTSANIRKSATGYCLACSNKEHAVSRKARTAQKRREHAPPEVEDTKTKKCSVCRKEKSLGAFHRHKYSSTGRVAACKTCAEDRRRLHRYGLTPADFARMKQQQQGKCYIPHCLNPATTIDHCHATGKVRKLLCQSHNTALQHTLKAGDFIALAAYLNEHES